MSANGPEETHALIAAAFNTGDLDAFIGVFEDDAALIVPPGGELVIGRAAIREALKETFELEPSATIEVIGMVEADGLALTLARWSLDGTDPEGGTVHMEGRGTTVSRRQPDGSWRIALDYPMRPD